MARSRDGINEDISAGIMKLISVIIKVKQKER